jgi:hypothetical protein
MANLMTASKLWGHCYIALLGMKYLNPRKAIALYTLENFDAILF